MLLARLSEEEKEWFSSLITNLLKPTYLKRYNLELGMDVMEDPMDFDQALDNLAKIEEDITKKAILLELACVSFSENHNHLEDIKKARILSAAKKFGIENVEEYITAAKELVPAQRKAFMLLGIW